MPHRPAGFAITTFLVSLLSLLSLLPSSFGLDGAVDVVNAEFIWQQGYNGDGVEIGIIDLFQADSTHPAINGNFLGGENFVSGKPFIGSHATAVTGAAVSQDPTRMGVAHGAGWWTGSTTKPSGIAQTRTMTVAAETFAQGLESLSGNPVEVLAMSIGFSGADTAVDQWSLSLDHIVSTLGTTVVVAAGNDGPSSSSFPGPPGAAYNILSVGATGGTGAVASTDYTQIAPYSTRGPTTDGRIKPDIVAPGSLIDLPTSGGAWTVASGTSFAAPIVAGGAALLVDMGQDLGFDVDAKVIKSVLMNSAEKLTGWTNSPTSPLDPNFGAGQMDLEAAFHQYNAGEQDSGSVNPLGWDHGSLTGSTSNTYTINAAVASGAQLSATLTWNRDVATDMEDIENAIYSASSLDNLELLLFDASDLSTPIASSVSTVDNVEHLFLTAPTSANYLFEVRSATGSVIDPVSYSLAWDVEIPTIFTPGDFNFDDYVNGFDFLEFQRGFGSLYDNSDYADWEDNFVSIPSPAQAAVESVPEPSTLVLAGLGVTFLSVVRRKRLYILRSIKSHQSPVFGQ